MKKSKLVLRFLLAISYNCRMAQSQRSAPCTVTHIDGSLVTFKSDQGSWYSAQLSLITRSDGSRASPTDIKVGMPVDVVAEGSSVKQATLRITVPRNVQPIPPVRNSCRVIDQPDQGPPPISEAQLRERFSEGVRHYSKLIFPIRLLKEEYKYSEDCLRAFGLIETKCVGMRKCCPGDENGFWSAFAVAYIEHLARRSSPLDQLERFRSYVTGCKKHDYDLIVSILDELERAKISDQAGYTWVRNMNQNSEFWYKTISFLKHFSLEYVRSFGDKPLLFLGDMDSATAELFMLSDGNVDIGIKIMAKVFNLKIIVFSPDIKDVKNKYAPEEEGVRLAYVYMFRENNLYHTLYSQAQLDVEGYSFDVCESLKHKESSNFSQLDYTTGARFKIPTQLGADLVHMKESVKHLTSFSGVAQEVVKNLVSLVGRRANSQFYTEDLINSSLLMMHEFNKSLAELTSFSGKLVGDESFIEAIIDTIKKAPLQALFQSEELFKRMNMCSYCHSKKGDVILDCAHSFCNDCIQKYVKTKLDEGLLLLRPNGEAVEEFVCPKINCFIRLSGPKFREIVGEEYFVWYLRYVEQTIMKRYCWRCMKTRGFDMFEPMCSCGHNICLLCYCDLYRRNDRYCLCGQELSQEAVRYMQQYTFQCPGCLAFKSMLGDFSQVECEEHILCQECLDKIVKGNGRCSHCYRKFNPQEVGEIQQFMEKLCCFCGKDCRQSRLNTQCGCIICMSCARGKTIQTQVCSMCFNCNTPLPALGYNTLVIYTKEYGQVPEPVIFCPICEDQIGLNEKGQLGCEDTFHKACLEDYFTIKITEGYSEDAIPCPMCHSPVPLQEVQLFIPPEIYGKYYENVMRTRTTPCPRCKEYVEDQDENGAKKSDVWCRNCKLHFCVACREAYLQGHNDKLCKFNQMQTLIKDLEPNLDRTDVLAQCPNCKSPFVKTSGCDNVKCRRQDCQTDFCAQCSVPSYQYKIHGNGWHRPSCKHHQPPSQDAAVNRNCRACVSQGKLCTPPKNLKVPRRFAFDEI